jgi:transcriptional regulator with XRE-family HTH domain
MRRSTRAARPKPARHSLSYQLREIIEARDLTAYAAARLAGIDPGVVGRFLAGVRDIRLATADRLAAALGLRLVEVGRAAGRRARANRPASAPATAAEPDGQGTRDAAEGQGS